MLLIKYNKSNILFKLLLLILLLSIIFASTSWPINNSIYIKWEAFRIFSCLLGLIFCIIIRKTFTLDIVTLIFLPLIFIVLLLQPFNANHIKNIFCFSFLLIIFSSKYFKTHHTFFFESSLLFIGILQSIIGYIQFIGKDNYIIGTYESTTGFSVTMCIIFPFLIQKYSTCLKVCRKVIVLLGIVLIGGIVLLSESRTGCIAITLIIASVFIKKKKYLIIFFVLGTICASLFFKTDSTTGRSFIYKTSLNLIRPQTFIQGIGDNQFKSKYMKQQALELSKKENNKYCFLADNIYHPLNEYLLLLIEQGIIITFILIGANILLLYLAYKKNKTIFHILLTITVFACFSYPFRYPFTILILSYSMSNILNPAFYTTRIKLLHKSILTVILLINMYMSINELRNQSKWKRQFETALLGNFSDAVKGYDELLSWGKENPLFLYNYAQVLHYNGEYQKSLNVLSLCIKFLNDYDTEMLAGDNFFKQKNYLLSEIHYLNAIQMCPNRFMPLYCLMNLYKEQKQYEKMKLISENIRLKKVKIPSETVDFIKQEASFLFEKDSQTKIKY